MGKFMPVTETAELGDGVMRSFNLEGHELLLANTHGQYYAVDNICPHMGGRLSDGTLEGTVVTCPRHSSQFDISDGHVVRWLKGSGLISAVGRALKSPRSLNIYRVKVEDDRIWVEF